MQRVKLSLACLLCLSWVGAARAQQAPLTPESQAGVASLQEYSGSATFRGTYIDVRTMTGDGVGYRQGYTQIGGAQPIWMGDNTVLTPTARAIVTDTKRIGANAGLVLRHYHEATDRIFGAHAWYDYDESVNTFDYHQVAFGFESLSSKWDVRGNVYLPTSSQDQFVKALEISNTPTFIGNYLAFLSPGLFEEALPGADWELGLPLTPATPWLRGFGGMYFYDGRTEDPVGFRGRIEAWVSDDLSLGVQVTEDRKFGTNVNAVVDFRFSGWKPTRYFPQWTTKERMLQPVQRNWRIATGTYVEDVPVLALNCDTEQPYFFVWVDNSNPAPGDGSFENPYSSLQPSFPEADVVLVRRGNTTMAAPLSGSVTLLDGQQFLGEGCSHQLEVCAVFGNLVLDPTVVNLPGFVDDGNFPFLSSGGNILTLADDNVVAGFNLVNAGGFAITNTAAGSNNFDLRCLNIMGNAAGGVFLTDATGIGTITDVNLLNNAGGGININTGAAGLQLTMTDVTSNGAPAGSQAFGIRLHADDGPLVAALTNVTANGNGSGIELLASGQQLDALLDTVTADGNVGNGITTAGVAGSDIFLRLLNTSASGNGGIGIAATVANSLFQVDGDFVTATGNGGDNLNFALTNTTFLVELNDSLFTDSVGGSGIVIGATGGSGLINLQDVTATGNFEDGLRVSANALADVDLFVQNSDFSNNGRDGISLVSAAGGRIDFIGDTLPAFGNGRDGFHFEGTTGGIINADLTNVTLDNSGRSAVYGDLDDATAVINITDSTGVRSGADGMFLQAVNGSDLTVTMTRGNLSDSGQTVDPAAAVRVIADNSLVNLLIVDTPLNNTVIGGPQDDGLNITATNSAVVNASLQNSDMSRNADNAIDVTGDTLATVTILLTNSNGHDSGNDGILFNLDGAAQLGITANNSSFDRSGLNGINGTLNNSSIAVFDFTDSTVANSGDNGMLIDADNGSTFTGTFLRGSFVNSGQNLNGVGLQDAMHLLADNGSGISITLTDTRSGNEPPNTTQDRSLFAVISNNSSLLFSNTNGNMSRNTLNAINVTFTGGSFGRIDLLNTLAVNSGEDGYLFVVDDSVLGSTVINGSFNNSGSGGVTGDAVDGTITNGGVVFLDFVNTNGNNALNNGLFITATGGSSFIGTFDNSSFNRAGNGINDANAIRLIADDSFMDVTLSNGSTGDFAGGDGLFINATNGSNVTVSVTDGSFRNSGQVTNTGAGINANSDASLVTVNLDNVLVTNFGGNTSQLYGLLFNAQNAGGFIFNATDSELSNNTLDGINGTATGPGSFAALTLIDTLVELNGLNGALFNITAGALLDMTAVGSSISFNGNYGVFGTVDGTGTIAFFDFTNTAIDNNGIIFGGDGFNVNPTNGAMVIANFTNGSISDNANRGINTFLDDGMAIYTIDSALINRNGNEGILFDVNGPTSVLQLVAINASLSNNGLAGVPPNGFDNVNGQVSGGLVDALFDNVDADSSTRHGFNFDVNDLTGPTTVNVQLNNGVSASNNANGNGVRFVSTGATTSAHLLMQGANAFDNNGTAAPLVPVPGLPGSGVYFEADNVLQAAVRFSGSASGNGNAANPFPGVDQDGVTIDINGATNAAVEINSLALASAGNVQDGFDIRLSNITTLANINVATIDVTKAPVSETVLALALDGINSTGNGDDGLSLILNNVGGTPDLSITNGQFTGNGGDGIHIELVNSSLNSLLIDNNDASNNGDDGIDFAVVTNSNLAAPGGTVFITNNIMDNNGDDGFSLVNPNTIDTNLNLDFIGNSASNNGNTGVDLQFAAPITTVSLRMNDNQVDNNGGIGVNLGPGTGVALNIPEMYGNVITSNGSFGVRMVLPDNASFVWALGSNAEDPNTINGNRDAGVGITMFGLNSTGVLNVANSTFNNNIGTGNPLFFGDGLAVLMSSNSDLTGSIVNSQFNENGRTAGGGDADGSGLRFTVTGNNAGLFARLHDFTIGGPTAADGNSFNNNSAFGIDIERTADGEIQNVLIDQNIINANRAGGIYILAANASKTDSYAINNNTITGNLAANGVAGLPLGNGVLFDIRADADMLVNMDFNTITGNANNGIHVIEQINNAADSRSITGVWTRNTITGNTNNGIHLNGAMAGLLVGDFADISLGNLISNNVNGSGILVNGPGTLTIGSNLIQQNGNLAQLGTAAEDAGIQVAARPFTGITIVNNDISFNFGDGVQWGIAQGFSGFTGFVTITDNNISNNRGRGIDIINRASNDVQVDISGNAVNSNLLEGVYIVNTSSGVQNQFDSSTTALDASGGVFETPTMEIRFFDNELIGNGLNSGASATGLFVRVGTATSTTSPFTNLPFATSLTTGVGTGPTVAFGGSPFGTTTGVGAVAMTVDGNFFSGNFGDDIRFASFVSTGTPGTGTTWDATTFNPAGYQSDPLARLDLWFRSNTFDSHDVNNGAGVSSAVQTNVAFYNNAEGTFKSRLNTATPAGPFTSATRRRNAQRIAARIPPFTAPLVSPEGGAYLYPGIGDSTFRVSADSDLVIFLVDPIVPNTSSTGLSQNGFFLPGSITGERPFGWGIFSTP